MPCALVSGLEGEKLQITIACCQFNEGRTDCKSCPKNPYALPSGDGKGATKEAPGPGELRPTHLASSSVEAAPETPEGKKKKGQLKLDG